MTFSNAYKLYAVNTAGGLIDGIINQRNTTNDEEMLIRADGQVDPTFVAMAQQMAVLGFDTVKVGTALGIIGIDGYAVTAAVTAFWQKMAQGGTRAGASSHIKMVCSTGLILPRQIRASQGQDPASISYEFALRSSDGETDPMTVTTGQSLSGSPTTDEAFTVGPVKYGSTLDDGVQDITIDFGIQEAKIAGGGHVYPTFVGIDGRAPGITVRTPDLDFAESTIGRAGRAITSGNTFKCWLRKKTEGGANVAAATASHILFTMTEGRIVLVSSEADIESTGVAELRVTPTFDDSNDIVAITNGAAIA